ncbi:MAG: hypothetical protein QM774_09905 [Gordonia sp. (in: high G+C Gram-positive bacteria)]|uniref:hypothetical protein n=1 Tax=Gordonia sp. (in: high G+C Gram-positive bacteria) TaxID=84139 RepID=UPI0039E52E05
MRRLIASALLVPVAVLIAGCGSEPKQAPATVTEWVTPGQAAPTTTVTTVTQTQQADSLPSAYVGQWVGHTRSIDLNADGSGELSLFSGAMNGTVWAVTWTGSGSGIAVTLQSKTTVSGDGAPMYSAGQTLPGSLSAQGGGQVLTIGTVTYCDSASSRSGICGA